MGEIKKMILKIDPFELENGDGNFVKTLFTLVCEAGLHHYI